MEFTTNKTFTTLATSFDLAPALSSPEHWLHQGTVHAGRKTPSLETALQVPTVMAHREMPWSCREHVIAQHTVTKCNEYMAGTSVESDSNPTDYKL